MVKVKGGWYGIPFILGEEHLLDAVPDAHPSRIPDFVFRS